MKSKILKKENKSLILVFLMLIFSILGTITLMFYHKKELESFSQKGQDNVDWAYFQVQRSYYPIHEMLLNKNFSPDELQEKYDLFASSVDNIEGKSFNFLLKYNYNENDDYINSIEKVYLSIKNLCHEIDDSSLKYGWNNKTIDILKNNENFLFEKTKTLSLLANQKLSLYLTEKQNKIVYIEKVFFLFFSLQILTFITFALLLFYNIFQLNNAKTELEKSNTLLTTSRDEVLAAYQSRTMFLAKMSHEIRTPLNSILGFSQVLEYDLENPLNEVQHKNLKYITDASKMVLDLSNEILDFSTLESGKVELRLENFNFYDLIRDTEVLLSSQLQQNNNKLVYNSKEDYVYADKLRTKQILINLITNAIKYGFNNTEILINTIILDKKLIFSVKNYGKSIPKEQQSLVFSSFYRANYNSVNIDGYGIGLSLSKKLTELMQGEIFFTSENNVTEFFVKLPKGELVNETIEYVNKEYVMIVSQQQRFIDSILKLLLDYKFLEALVVPDSNYARDIIDYADIPHLIYTEGMMAADFEDYLKDKEIDIVKFDLDMIDKEALSLSQLEQKIKGWKI
jgi:signal transduction histidine kinase